MVYECGAIVAGGLNNVSDNGAISWAVLGEHRLVEVRELVFSTSFVVPGIEIIWVDDSDCLVTTNFKGHLPASSHQSFCLGLKIYGLERESNCKHNCDLG